MSEARRGLRDGPAQHFRWRSRSSSRASASSERTTRSSRSRSTIAARAPWATRSWSRTGRADSIPDLARELGVPEGPLWGEIHRGRAVTLADGRVIEPSVLVGAPRPGRRVVITGDTRPCAATIDAARGADLLVHEATFGDEEAAARGGDGPLDGARGRLVARDAGVGALLLTHFSARYSRDATRAGEGGARVLRGDGASWRTGWRWRSHSKRHCNTSRAYCSTRYSDRHTRSRNRGEISAARR